LLCAGGQHRGILYDSRLTHAFSVKFLNLGQVYLIINDENSHQDATTFTSVASHAFLGLINRIFTGNSSVINKASIASTIQHQSFEVTGF